MVTFLESEQSNSELDDVVNSVKIVTEERHPQRHNFWVKTVNSLTRVFDDLFGERIVQVRLTADL